MMEEARAIGELAKTGWRPKRRSSTPPGTARSRACSARPNGSRRTPPSCARRRVGLHQHRLERPRLSRCRRSHTLEHSSTRSRATSPIRRAKVSVLERAARARRSGRRGRRRTSARRSASATLIRLDALGSGSDYTPFLQHLGIASLNIGFGGEDGGGRITRSTTRSITTRASATRLRLRRRAGEDRGRMMLRLANADVLPFETTTLADDDRRATSTR